MNTSNEKSKCCSKCFGSISGLQWWCNDTSCPCHKPSVEVSRCKNCGEKETRHDMNHNLCAICSKPFEPQSIPLNRD